MPLLSALLVFALAAPAQPAAAAKYWVYVGTYTGGKDGSKGIYRCDFDPQTGKLGPSELVAEIASPSYLALHPSGKYLFAVGELDRFAGKKGGAVSAFAIDPRTGKLALLNQQPSSGTGPCYIALDRGGKNALVANYSGGSVAVLPIGEKGRLKPASVFWQFAGSSVNKERQEASHAHCINVDPTNRFTLVADLGLDQVKIFHFDPIHGRMPYNDPRFYKTAPGAGPRHFTFHPNGKWAYLIHEMGLTLSALAWNADKGQLTEMQTVPTLPAGADRRGASTVAVVVHPSGKFVYGSNRGNDTIVTFAIDGSTGRLTLIGHQGEGIKTPRDFNIDPTGRWLIVANQDGASLLVFRIDPETGKLSPTGQRVAVPAPVCVKFLAVPR